MMRRKALLLVTLLTLTLTLTAQQARPRIGLALGGGGAKGAAHVGVLKVIEQAGVHIDYIAGTSIGAIVGSLYAAGFTATELDSLFCSQQWLQLLTDRNMELSGEPWRQKDGVTYVFGFPVIDQGNLTFGVLQGNSVEQMIDSMLATRNEVEFDQLRTPFRCVAAELKTATEVVLSEGTVPRAVRASMAIPGVFKPVSLDGRQLVDGGMMNNLPVDVVLDMGADIVIAVDLQQNEVKPRKKSNSPIVGLAEIVGLGRIAEWVTTRPDMTKLTENRQLADIYINPPLPDYEASSFGNANMRSMIDIGQQEAMKSLDALLRLSDGDKQ